MEADEILNKTLNMLYPKFALSFFLLIFKLLSESLENIVLFIANASCVFSKFINQATSYQEFLFAKKARIDSFNYENAKIKIFIVETALIALLFSLISSIIIQIYIKTFLLSGFIILSLRCTFLPEKLSYSGNSFTIILENLRYFWLSTRIKNGNSQYKII